MKQSEKLKALRCICKDQRKYIYALVKERNKYKNSIQALIEILKEPISYP